MAMVSLMRSIRRTTDGQAGQPYWLQHFFINAYAECWELICLKILRASDLHTRIARLQKLLEVADSDAAELAQELIQSVTGDKDRALFSQILAHLESYDFEAALSLLKRYDDQSEPV